MRENPKYHLTVGWLYPDLMSTYGDRGNIFVLQRRCEWRGIGFSVLPISHNTKRADFDEIDIIFGGGAQDREQEIVMRDLQGDKGAKIKEHVEQEKPALFVCGSPQLMGNYYEPAEGKRIEGVGVFDMVSIHPGKNVHRLIGNIVGEIFWEHLGVHPQDNSKHDIIVGFENHGGRTFLGPGVRPFAKVLKGYGNNGKDGTEGVAYKNAIGCYFHGPLLPKNPRIADWIIQKAVEVKYHETVELKELDDTLEKKAQIVIAKRLKVGV